MQLTKRFLGITLALALSALEISAQVKTFVTYTVTSWSGLTTYSSNDMVTTGTGTGLVTYISLLPINVGNVPAATIGTAWNVVGSAGTGGGLTSFTVANLPPLFTATLGANPTTAPALAFTLSNVAQNSVFVGPATGGAGVPSFQTAPTFSAANLTNFPLLNQNTTGTAAALGAAPTLCSTSQAPTGILANGNATGCFTPPYTAPTPNAIQYVNGSGVSSAATAAQFSALFNSTPSSGTGILFSDATVHQQTPVGTNAQVPQSNGSGYTPVTISGDSTLAFGGAMLNTGLNGVLLSGLGSGLLRNTTGSGVPSIETPAQFLADASAGLKTGTNCNTSNAYYFSPFSGTCVLAANPPTEDTLTSTTTTTALNPNTALTTVTLATNFTFTLAAPTASTSPTSKCLVFVQGGTFTVSTTSTSVHGFFTVGNTSTTGSNFNRQCLDWVPSQSAWLAGASRINF